MPPHAVFRLRPSPPSSVSIARFEHDVSVERFDAHTEHTASFGEQVPDATGKAATRAKRGARAYHVIGRTGICTHDDFGHVSMAVHANPRNGVSRRNARTAREPDANILRVMRHKKPNASDHGMSEPTYCRPVFVVVVVAEHRRHRSKRLEASNDVGTPDIACVDDVIAFRKRSIRLRIKLPMRIGNKSDPKEARGAVLWFIHVVIVACAQIKITKQLPMTPNR